MDLFSGAVLATLIGLAGGIALGLAARVGRFCTLGAIEDALYGARFERLRMWGIALGLSMSGCSALSAGGLLSASGIFLVRDGFSPLVVVLGGGMFGYGMALAGNCGYGALARIGTGDFRAFLVVVVMGLSAYAALFGPLAGLRLWLFDLPVLRVETPTTLDVIVSEALALPVWTIGLAVGLGLVALSLLGAQKPGQTALWGAVVALAIVSGWGGTAYLAATSFDVIGVRSHNFAAPIGETLAFVMMSSVRPISFAVGSVFGVVAGSILGSLWLRQFRWEACEDPRELRRQLLGAVMMGVGATLALGCSVGQGLSAFAILTLSAPLATLAILAGAALGLRTLIQGWSLRGDPGI